MQAFKCVSALLAILAVVEIRAAHVATLNFALNLEYLEANFYSFVAYGRGIDTALRLGGPAAQGPSARASLTPAGLRYARSIANDEINHVKVLQAAIRDLGGEPVAQPAIDLRAPIFVALLKAATKKTNVLFNPYAQSANDVNFLISSFIFEDVGVSAYQGATRALVEYPDVLETAAGILATEAYHAGFLRTTLSRFLAQPVGARSNSLSVGSATRAISDLRSKVDGHTDATTVTEANRNDQPLIYMNGGTNDGLPALASADKNGVTYPRTAQQVLRIVYLGNDAKGGFFPNGLNGEITDASA